jgi:SAM-dependent methyltransferase
MDLTLEQLEFLASGQADACLRDPLPTDPLARMSALRKRLDPDQAAAVAELADLRRRAERSGRFTPELATCLLATDRLLQQASSLPVASHKAALLDRLADPGDLWDLCCGMGIDALALADRAGRVRAVDRSPAAVRCTRHNARCAGLAERCDVLLADVGDCAIPPRDVVHIDPDRRACGKRDSSLVGSQPDARHVEQLIRSTRAGVVKLSPALDERELGDWPVAREYVGEAGVCKQLLAWWGATDVDRPPGQRRATVLRGAPWRPDALSLVIRPDARVETAETFSWIFEPDPAVLAAGGAATLAEDLHLRWIRPGLTWLAGDGQRQTPLAEGFEVLDQVPGRFADVARALRRLDAGIVEIKPRGLSLDTDRMQQRLRGRGPKPLTVLWGRLGQSRRAFICRRARRS